MRTQNPDAAYNVVASPSLTHRLSLLTHVTAAAAAAAGALLRSMLGACEQHAFQFVLSACDSQWIQRYPWLHRTAVRRTTTSQQRARGPAVRRHTITADNIHVKVG